METLSKSFQVSDIQETIVAEFEPAYNLSRFASCNGKIVFSSKKVYVMANYMAGMVDAIGSMVTAPKCFAYDEIASYNKTGLAGYKITLKDGTEFNFSNVFGKMRKGITAAIEEGLAG